MWGEYTDVLSYQYTEWAYYILFGIRKLSFLCHLKSQAGRLWYHSGSTTVYRRWDDGFIIRKMTHADVKVFCRCVV